MIWYLCGSNSTCLVISTVYDEQISPSAQIISPAVFPLMCLLLLIIWFGFNKSYEGIQTVRNVEPDTRENAVY